MTDQDPTQAYEPAPPPAPAAPPPAPDAPPVTYEPPPAVATTPVAATTAARPGRSKLKWIVAGVVTLLVAGTAAGATLLLTSDSADPAVMAWAPADSVVYSELRLDLPGDQATELAEVMKAFPGFEDQAAFPMKLDEALDQLVGAATDGEQSWQEDIDPWFGGQVAVSSGPLPTEADPTAARFLLLLSTDDAAKATAWAAEIIALGGTSTTTETHNGVTITLAAPPEGAPDELKGMQGGYAVYGPVLAFGDPDSIKASIDTQGKTGLPTNAQFQEAEASVTGDRLGFAYMDLASIAASAQAMAGEAAELVPASVTGLLEDSVAPWAAASLRAEDGAFVVDTRSPHVAAMGEPKNAESKLPSVLPPTTVFLAEGHDVGEALARTKDMLAQAPELEDTVKQVEDALALVGGFETVTGWIGEAGIAVARDGDQVSGGLVISPTDAAAAEQLLAQLKAFIQLGGAQAGLSVSEESYAGTTITVIDLGGLGDMLGESTGGVIPEGGLTLAYAVTDQVVVFGYGADFVKGVLDAAGEGQSLADMERFTTALARAGTSHASLLWVDVAGVRDLVESMIPSDSRTDYDANLKPYLQAFDTVIGTTTPGDSIDEATLILSVAGD